MDLLTKISEHVVTKISEHVVTKIPKHVVTRKSELVVISWILTWWSADYKWQSDIRTRGDQLNPNGSQTFEHVVISWLQIADGRLNIWLSTDLSRVFLANIVDHTASLSSDQLTPPVDQLAIHKQQSADYMLVVASVVKVTPCSVSRWARVVSAKANPGVYTPPALGNLGEPKSTWSNLAFWTLLRQWSPVRIQLALCTSVHTISVYR